MGNPPPPKIPVSITPSLMGGKERRAKVKLWKNLAESSARINLLRILIREGIGLNEVEEFGMGLQSKFKSQKFKNSAKLTRKDGKIVEHAMKNKLADEQCYFRELVVLRNKARREIDKKIKKNSKPYRKFMLKLGQEEKRKKTQMTIKFKKKVDHLKKKYNSDKNQSELTVPEDIQEFSENAVFDKKKFDTIEETSYDVKVIGDIELSDQEKQVLRLHPKFCVAEKFQPIQFEQEQEAALAKLRMEFRKQEENKELSEEEVQECEEFEALCRQVYDPMTQEYDARKKRVTDLQECAKVTLPKPLSAENEAKLELRKTTQMEIFRDYLHKNGDKNKESNLTQEEKVGLKSLQKRMKENDLVILKTDKSSKFAVTNKQEYIQMGQEHVAKDKMINRQELIETEETINGHTRAWTHIWGSGKNHNHFDRILSSKVTHSENVANLYLMFKDHKPGTRTRPTATGHSSNSLGLSNSVAEILEAVANSENKRYNTISSEDMLHRIHNYNKSIETRTKTAPLDKKIQKPEASQGVPEPWDQEQQEVSGQEQEKEYCVIGSDVKALYPSIKSKKTGQIIRKRVENSKINFEGFDTKAGLAYIAMNTNLTEVDEIEHLLPLRKSGKTTQLKMSAIKNDWDPEERYEFKNDQYTTQETRKIQSRVIEIATRTLFENHLYKFGNQTYKQMSGGSIGDRWTGAASEIVMQEWAEQYEHILVSAGLEVHLLAGYVDDGRQGTTALKPGMRFDKEDKKFKYSAEAEQEDKTKRQEGETPNQRMARLCLPAMNSINTDLEFTVECADDYDDKKLPTLDFVLWQDKKGKINHSYYQKPTKTPFIIMSRSAAPQQQKIQVLSNELTRRLLNINRQENDQPEFDKTIDKFTQEAKNSGYNRNTTREIVISGIRGWKNRLQRKQDLGQEEYRSAKNSLQSRTRKKLLSRENWYKKQESEPEKQDKNYKTNGLPGGPRALGTKTSRDKNIKQDKNMIRAVMFVPYTPNGELAKSLRQNEEKLSELTGTKLKIVERTGTKLQDILTKSNPWQGENCTRKNCLLCHTKARTGKLTSQECSKRNIVYETTCVTCENEAIKDLENLDLEEKEKVDKKKEIKLFKYIGESSRSAYERGWEHVNDMTTLNPRSHMLKHILLHHPGQEMLSIEFDMKIRKFCKTSFERQVLEAVTIQQEKNNHHLMNSKSEYNRCSLPRLSTKLGEKEIKELVQEQEIDKKDEEFLDKRIRELRKQLNKKRLHPTKETGPKPKRRKVGNSDYVSIGEIWGKPDMSKPAKFKMVKDENPKNPKVAKIDKISPEKPRIPTFPPPPEKIEISQLLPKSEQFRQERLRKKQEKEKAWELRKLCHEFLQDNDKDWEKRKIERIEEKNRQERLEKMKIKSRNSKIKHIENVVNIGLNKIPKEDREKIKQEEKLQEYKELHTIKQDLWKLRKKEKKLVETEEIKNIRKMTKKLENIQEILEREKRKKHEKEQEIKRRMKKREDNLKKAAEKAEKWAMIRWINEYIEENTEKWEDIDLVRIAENHEKQEYEEETGLIAAQEKYEKQEEEEHHEKTKKRKYQDFKNDQEILPSNPPPLPSTTEKPVPKWQNWRSNKDVKEQVTPEKQHVEKQEQETRPRITLKQATLTELANNKKKIGTETTSKQEPNKITRSNENNTIKTNTTNNKNKMHIMIKKPVLPEPKQAINNNGTKKQETTTRKVAQENNKITNFFIRKQESTLEKLTKQDTGNNKPIKPKPPRPKKPEPDSSKKKNKKAEEMKNIEKQRGYWTKLAEKQRKKQEEASKPKENHMKNPLPKVTKIQHTTPEMPVSQQANCLTKSPVIIASENDVLETSIITTQRSDKIKNESEITLGIQTELGKSYKYRSSQITQ